MTCGIYQIKNKVTGDIYIGSSSNVEKRLNEHRRKLLINLHHSIRLQRSYNKYGLISFEFSLICKCDLFLKLYMEQLYLETMKPTFNTSLSSSAPMQGRKHSEKTKMLLKNREVKKGKDSPSYGKKWTEEQKIKVLKYRIGSKRSEECKSKMRETNIRNNQGKYLKEYVESLRKPLVDNFGNTYLSLSDAANRLGVKVATICDLLKGRHRSIRKKYRLKYINDIDFPYIPPVSRGSTNYIGVKKKGNRYQARIAKDGIVYNLGWYATPIEAAVEYNNKAKELHGELAVLNIL
jgi:group I intron endonuclease